MALISTQSIDNDGLVASYTAVSASDTFVPTAGAFLHVKNGNVASTNVGLVTPGTVDGLPVGDRTVAVAAGAEAFIRLDPTLYRASNGLGTVTFSVTGTVTAAVLRS